MKPAATKPSSRIKKAPAAADAVIVENVSKSFGSTKVLQNVSLRVAQGEVFGLLGPNGAGKSTLLNILCGMQKQDSGSISFFSGGQGKGVRKGIALVPQDFAFYHSFSVLDNLLFFWRQRWPQGHGAAEDSKQSYQPAWSCRL